MDAQLADALLEELPRGFDLRDYLESLEQRLIVRAMESAGGTVAQAARLLGLRRTTLVEKLRKYALGGSDTRGAGNLTSRAAAMRAAGVSRVTVSRAARKLLLAPSVDRTQRPWSSRCRRQRWTPSSMRTRGHARAPLDRSGPGGLRRGRRAG